MNPTSTHTFRHRLAIIACFATMFMLGISISLLGPSLQDLAQRTGTPLARAGLFFTLFSSGSVLATLFIARLNDRPARHVVLILGSLLLAAGHWLVAGSQTFAQAGLAIAVCGMAMSATGTAPNAIIADLYRGRAGQALNALHLVVGIGGLVGPLLIAGAVRLGRDYTAAYRLVAIMLLLLAVLWIVSRPPRPHRSDGHSVSIARSALAPLALLFGLAMLYTGSEQLLSGWLATYARIAGHVDTAVASLTTSVFWLAILLGRLTAVAALRRLTSPQLLRICALLGIAGVGVVLLGSVTPVLLWVGVALVGFGFGPIFPTTLGLTGEFAADHAGAVGSLFVASGSIGAMFLPWAAGMLIPSLGIRGSIALTWAPLAAVLLCVEAVARLRRRSA